MTDIKTWMARHGRTAAGSCLAAGLALAGWTYFRPEPAVLVPLFHALPPRPARAVAIPDGGRAPEDEPLAEEAPAEVRATPNELPEEPTRRDLEAGMDRVKKWVARCQALEAATGTLTVRLVIAKSGGVQSVAVFPPFDKTPTGECVAKAIRREASFPRFKGELTPSLELVYPFFFRGTGEGVL